jgi:hypothetical protein
VALTAINHRKNETAQHRNTRDPERRWVLEHEHIVREVLVDFFLGQ